MRKLLSFFHPKYKQALNISTTKQLNDNYIKTPGY